MLLVLLVGPNSPILSISDVMPGTSATIYLFCWDMKLRVIFPPRNLCLAPKHIPIVVRMVDAMLSTFSRLKQLNK